VVGVCRRRALSRKAKRTSTENSVGKRRSPPDNSQSAKTHTDVVSIDSSPDPLCQLWTARVDKLGRSKAPRGPGPPHLGRSKSHVAGLHTASRYRGNGRCCGPALIEDTFAHRAMKPHRWQLGWAWLAAVIDRVESSAEPLAHARSAEPLRSALWWSWGANCGLSVGGRQTDRLRGDEGIEERPSQDRAACWPSYILTQHRAA
jgi:hypothetical protein